MLDLQQGLNGSHVYSSDPFSRINDNYDKSRTNNFGTLTRRTARTFENYGDSGGGRIEFRANMEESGVTSPPLWKTSTPPSSPPTEATPLHPRPHHQHYRHLLSPTSRSQVIARGQQELMEMIKSMPETSYELSLKDLVEQPTVQGVRQTTVIEERELIIAIQSEKRKNTNKKKNEKKMQMSKHGSMDSGAFLLKMFIPTLGLKKSSKMGTGAKVSPRPPLIEGEKGVDKEWSKKTFSVAGESENSSIDKNSASSDSSRSRNMSDFLPSCWSFHAKKSKNRGQKGSRF